MSVSIRPIHADFAGEVTGVDCARPLSAEAVAAIEAGMDRYAVLVFRDQPLTDPRQIDFTRHFGELEGYNTPGHIRKQTESRLGPGIADFSNLDKSGAVMSDQDRVWFFKLGDRLWHSDSSFRPVPAKYSLLSGRIIPSWGANTEFADMRAAYDALDARTKAEVEDLVCLHSLMYSREAIGFTDLTPEERVAFRGAHASGDRPPIAVPRLPRRRDRGMDNPRGANVPARPDRVRDPGALRLLPCVAGR
jgi:alpha-ketoglutarate-dependent 2,4-dichlorophenoxyacetate dioxygenase